ncbi:MAG: hypothetical protein WD042_04020 [Phycisphaeraceae bacterium]
MCRTNPKSAIRRLQQRKLNPKGSRRGFTLIEAALTTVIVGTGVLAIVAAQQAYLKKNDWAQRTGTAVLLANEIRELTLTLPMHDPLTGKQVLGPEANELSVSQYDDLDDFAGVVNGGLGAGVSFAPPINALRQPIADLDRWTQEVQVTNVLPSNIGSTLTQPLGTTSLMRVTVTIKYQDPTLPADEPPMTITDLSWVVGE